MIKIGSFFEAHIEKIILVIVGIVSIWLMITRVIFSPNQVSYGEGKYSPAAIDEQVNRRAQELREKINTPPEDLPPYKSQRPEFVAMLDSSISDINVNIWPQVPFEVEGSALGPGGKGRYRLPVIGAVNEVDVEHIRAAAYVPTDVITAENQYDKAATEPNDIDLITVEAKFDVEGLYKRFQHCFVEDVERQYSDPCLAKPIFAAVQLQRQELGQDGRWGDWKDIPRIKIDHYGPLFDIVEDAGSLPPGRLKVWKLQFDNWQVQIDLLQPEAYAMASAYEEWYPPVIHRKFLDIQRKEDAEEKRKAREDEQKNNERADSRRTRRTGLGGTTGRLGGGYSDMGSGLYSGGVGGDTSRRRSSRTRSDRSGRTGTSYDSGMPGTPGTPGMPGATDRRSRRSSRRTTEPGGIGIDGYGDMLGMPGDRLTRRGPSMFDVYQDFDKIRLTARTPLEKMKEPLVFWAHDDTVEPRNTYRYRIRLGVLNPLAGTDQIGEQDVSRKNEVVLWSEFSKTTEPVEIPGRMYFFAKHIREPANVVTVQVSKYVLGYWYSEDFKVSEGELIGNVVETETETEADRQRNQRRTDFGRGMLDPRMAPGGAMMDPRMGAIGVPREKSVVPETIDYGTGAVMVDAVPVIDWSGDKNLTERHYYNMLYSMDGTDIEHMPVRTAYWAKDLRDMYGMISILEKETREPFKSFSARKTRPGARPGGDMGGYEDMYYDDMMYEDMGMMPY
jgi:hypothetical protein